MTAEPAELRLIRARAIRLAKAENKRTDDVPLCSFNLEALALMFVQPGQRLPQALLATWFDGANDLRRRLTPDPAGVSAPIKVVDRNEAIRRLDFAAARLSAAIAHDDDETRVRSELKQLWPEYVASDRYHPSKAQTAVSLSSGKRLGIGANGGITFSGPAVKKVRSFGDPRI